jgi:hypothetical protein
VNRRTRFQFRAADLTANRINSATQTDVQANGLPAAADIYRGVSRHFGYNSALAQRVLAACAVRGLLFPLHR